MWNPKTCDCECNKSWKTGEFLEIKHCAWKKCEITIISMWSWILNTTDTTKFGYSLFKVDSWK